MSELAERIRAAVERRNRNEEAIASEGAIGVSHWPTTQERNELRVELSDLLHDNAPTILAGLAALESDPSATLAALDEELDAIRRDYSDRCAEIARLRADVERKDEALLAFVDAWQRERSLNNQRGFRPDVASLSFDELNDLHVTITAALADSADKQPQTGG